MLGKNMLLSTLVGGLLLGATLASPQPPLPDKCDRFLTQELGRGAQEGTVVVILRYQDQLSPSQEAQLKALQGDIYRRLPFIQSVAVRFPRKNLARVAALPFVNHLSSDLTVRKFDEYTVGATGAGVAFQQYGVTGAGVTVAVVDSGIYDHPDLRDPATGASRVVGQASFVSPSLGGPDPYGHGTHVAGIISGNGAASRGPAYSRTFWGIAPQSKLVSVRVLDAVGSGDTSSVLAGIQWVLNNKARYNIRVMNLSLGHAVGEPYTTDPLCRAVETAWKAGIVVVCAAGNDGRQNPIALSATSDNEGYGTAYGSVTSPGNDPYVLTVGAMKTSGGSRTQDRVATYSGRGPSRLDFVMKPDIVAPGNGIISLRRPLGSLDITNGPTNIVPPSAYYKNPSPLSYSSYFQLSGTSMAAPVVAGAAALLLQANPNLSPDTVKARLMVTADKWLAPNGSADPCTFGAGYLNIPAALASSIVPTTYAISPILVRGATEGEMIITFDGEVAGTKAIWGTQALWGTKAIWGSSLWLDLDILNILNVSALPKILAER